MDLHRAGGGLPVPRRLNPPCADLSPAAFFGIGDSLHRLLGRIWAVSLVTIARVWFGIRRLNPGQLGYIRIFSTVTMITVPLLTAGHFTLIPGRMSDGWLGY